MPAKKKSAARKRTTAPAKTKKPAAKKKAAAKKKPAATKGVVRTGAIPESILKIAERSTERQLQTRSTERDAAKEQMDALRAEERESIRDRLAEASKPATVVQERMPSEPSDSLTMAQSEPIAAAAVGGNVMIDVEDVHVFYGAVEALRGISFRVHEGETVAIIGSNGAGKTTTLKTVSGVSELLKTVRGHITIMGKRVEAWPAHRIARLGVAHSPEGRKVFPNQSVRDNLMLGAFGRMDSEIDTDIAKMEDRFPILGQRRNQPAGLLSGGEQQMLAMGRALMARPKVLLFDEPSMGLAPLIVKQIFEIIEELKREGKTILLVEQMAFQALAIADRGYVLETGEITMEGSGMRLLDDPRVKEAYLGA